MDEVDWERVCFWAHYLGEDPRALMKREEAMARMRRLSDAGPREDEDPHEAAKDAYYSSRGV